MAITKIFRDVAIKMAVKQRKFVDALTEESPILATMPMMPASHGFSNTYEKLLSISSAQLVDLDDELPQMDIDSKLEQEDLSVIGGTMFVGADKARKFGGPIPYFSGKLSPILRDTAAFTENSIIYNNFRKFAIDNGKVIDIEGSNNTNFSIIVVKWSEGETTGLFDSVGFGNGKVLEATPLSGGNLFLKTFTTSVGVTKEIPVFGSTFKTYFGVQLANERYVSAMVNIDIDNATPKEPTETQISELLHLARANSANTRMYMHPRLLTFLGKFKESHLRMNVMDSNLNRMIDMWDGIPIISSYNFDDGTEANV